MKAKIVDGPVALQQAPGQSASTVAQIADGEEIEIGGPQNGWVPARRASGEKGFIPGSTRTQVFRRATLKQDRVVVRETPDDNGQQLDSVGRGYQFLILGAVKGADDAPAWVRVRLGQSREGFIPGATNIKILPEITRQVAQKNMTVGALWCVGGLVVTIGTYLAAASGGTYFVTWGAILFGGIQLMRGIAQYSEATI
jgi:hypothetical protein